MPYFSTRKMKVISRITTINTINNGWKGFLAEKYHVVNLPLLAISIDSVILSSSELSSFASRVWGGLQVAVGAKRDSTRTEERPKKSPPKLDSEAGETSDKSLRILADYVEATAEKGVDGIIKEYRRLDNFFDPAASYEAFKSNMTKNRYSDVVCTDSTRVKLRFGGKEFGDYIHANHVVNPLLTTKFICTQGPLESTVDDFWRMIYQERVESILMLCKPAEDGRVKCHVYWPEDVNKVLEMPLLQVTNTGEDSEFNTLTLLVELSQKYELTEDCLSESLRKPLIVKLFRWISWPDRGVPDETSCIIPLRLLDRVRHAPCIIHCSAGIGRTGSFLALEIALQRIVVGKKIEFEQITRELRCSRAQCVQTEAQYLYIHRVMVDNALRHINLPEKAIRIGRKFLQEYDEKMKK